MTITHSTITDENSTIEFQLNTFLADGRRDEDIQTIRSTAHQATLRDQKSATMTFLNNLWNTIPFRYVESQN